MSNLQDISQAIHLMTHDPRQAFLDERKKEDKQQLRDMTAFWGKRNVELWLSNIPEDGPND